MKEGTYDKWALEMSQDFDNGKGVTGTPTIRIDGKEVTEHSEPVAELARSRSDDGGRSPRHAWHRRPARRRLSPRKLSGLGVDERANSSRVRPTLAISLTVGYSSVT